MRITQTIEFIRYMQPPEGYYLAFSGGKDSVVIYHLCKMAGVKFDAHYNLTTVDPPELVRFIRTNFPDVEEIKPKKSMWQLIEEKGMVPTRRIRYCCAILKEGSGSGRMVMTGVRKDESSRRAKRGKVEGCIYDSTKTFIHPIFDWTEKDVWDFIHSEKLPFVSLYNDGFSRVGCIGCPLAGAKNMVMEFRKYPKYYNAYLHAMARMLETRRKKGLKTKWKTPEDVMKWWIYGGERWYNPEQCELFEESNGQFI